VQNIENCGQCQAIRRWEEDDTDGLVVARTQTGYVVLFGTQYFPGHTLFVSRPCLSELHEFGSQRAVHLEEMGCVAEAVFRAFEPQSLNYAALGISAPHLHWSLMPRYAGEPEADKTAWQQAGFWAAVQSGERADPSIEVQRFKLLAQELQKTDLKIEKLWDRST